MTMHDYNLYMPTRLVFGKGRLGELSKFIAGRGKKVLLAYGGGSVKKIGLYDKVKELLKDYEVFELSGIEPNPKIGSVRQGVEIVKREKIDFIVALGGGSVIDCVKNIAVGAYYDGDPWDLVLDPTKETDHTPFFVVLTLSATGSEYDGTGVISNPDTNEKMALGGEIFPEVSIMDPEYTMSVPKSQTAAGSADIFNHTLEAYLVKDGNELSDGFCEAMLRTVIKNAPKALQNPNDYDARAELMMASSFGCCGLLNIGRTPSTWMCHGIEHEVSAFHDITHGVGLAILTPALMRASLNQDTVSRYAQYGVKVFGIDASLDPMDIANKAIVKTEEFFKSLGLPSRLRDAGVDTDAHFEEMADHVTKTWFADFKDAMVPLDKDGIVKVLKACY